MKLLNILLRSAQTELQEFGPQMAVLLLPGGYLIALTGWLQRHLPRHLPHFGRHR